MWLFPSGLHCKPDCWFGQIILNTKFHFPQGPWGQTSSKGSLSISSPITTGEGGGFSEALYLVLNRHSSLHFARRTWLIPLKIMYYMNCLILWLNISLSVTVEPEQNLWRLAPSQKQLFLKKHLLFCFPELTHQPQKFAHQEPVSALRPCNHCLSWSLWSLSLLISMSLWRQAEQYIGREKEGDLHFLKMDLPRDRNLPALYNATRRVWTTNVNTLKGSMI
jgi:hypothetical protein